MNKRKLSSPPASPREYLSGHGRRYAGGARRHGNRRDSPRPHDPANQTRLLPLALQGLSEPHTGQVPLAPASRLGRQLLRLVVGVRYKILESVVMVYLRFRGGFSRRRSLRLLLILSTASNSASKLASVIKVLATAWATAFTAFHGGHTRVALSVLGRTPSLCCVLSVPDQIDASVTRYNSN